MTASVGVGTCCTPVLGQALLMMMCFKHVVASVHLRVDGAQPLAQLVGLRASIVMLRGDFVGEGYCYRWACVG